MADVSSFWSNDRFHDATLILGSDRSLLERKRTELQQSLDGCIIECGTSEHDPKRLDTSSDPDPSQASSTGAVASSTFQHPVLTLPVHRIILSSGSEYFNTAISTLIGNNAAASGNGSEHTLHPIILVQEDNIDAAQGVLQYLYTQTVESVDGTATKFMHMLMIADRWVVPGCVAACCKAMMALYASAVTFEEVLLIYSPTQGALPPSIRDSADFKPVLEFALWKLLELFGDVPTVIASPTLTAQVLQLPHIALLALLSSDKLTTDSEDSVLMLLSWWLYRDTEGDGDDKEEMDQKHGRCDQEALSLLRDTIRYRHISAAYFADGIPRVLDLQPSKVQLAELHYIRSLTPAHAALYLAEEHESSDDWFKPQRPVCASSNRTSLVSLSLEISKAQLSQYLTSITAAEEGGPTPSCLSTSVHFKGFNFTLGFGSDEHNSRFWTYVDIRLNLPKQSSYCKMFYGIPCSICMSIMTKGQEFAHYSEQPPIMFLSTGYGWDNFAHAMSRLPGDQLQISWWEPFLVDGHMRLTVEVYDERTG